MISLDRCDELIGQALAAESREAFQTAVAPLVSARDILSFGLGRGSTYWRARIVETSRYDELKAMDYPPAELVKRAGRLNDVGDPCFYVASTLETAVAEVQAVQGQLVQVAGFRIVPEKVLRLVFLGEYQSVYKRGFVSFAGTDPGNSINKLLQQQSLDDLRVLLLIDNFLAHVMSDKNAEKSCYLHSRALRDLLLSEVPAHGVAFPSVRDIGGVNFGVLPAPSDQLFHNVCCVVVKLGKKRSFAPHDMQFVGIAAGLTDDRKRFVWKDGEAHSDLVMYNMTREEYESRGSIGT